MRPPIGDRWLISIVWHLDRLRWVPRAALDKIVRRDGLCFWAYTEGDPPELTDVTSPDRELAFRCCAGCPVQDECLELELRTSGEDTIGVWGAMAEDDRRALYPHWHQRGDHAEDVECNGPKGGPTP